jgi:hypothetical protein
LVWPTKKIYLDGGSNTYFHEVSADKLDVVVGGQTILEVAEGGGGASDYVAIQALNKLYLDGGTNTYIHERGADHIGVIAGGNEVANFNYNSGNQYIESAQDFVMPATGKFYLDGSSNTYLHEVSADKVDLVVGGQTILEVAEGGGGASDYVAIQALNKLYLDGGGDTYIHEASANAVQIITGGEAYTFHAGGLEIPALNKLYFDGGSDTYLYQYADNNVRLIAGTVDALSIGSNGIVFNEDSQNWDFRVESNDNANMFTIDGGDNTVGIGVAPKAVFHVKNTGNSWEDGILLQHHTGDTGWNIHPEDDGDNALWFGYNADTTAALTSQTATARMVLHGDGKVGIGDTSPEEMLTIVAPSGDCNLRMEGDAIRIKKSGTDFIYYDGSNLKLSVGNAEKLRAKANGVGMGITAPVTKLHVGSNTSQTLMPGTQQAIINANSVTSTTNWQLAIEGDNDSGILFTEDNAKRGLVGYDAGNSQVMVGDNDGDNSWRIATNSDTIYGYTGGTERFQISTGRINTTLPMTVTGADFTWSDGGDSSVSIKDGGTNAVYMLCASGDEFYLGANGTSYGLRVTTSNNVEVNGTLTVSGTVTANGSIVGTTINNASNNRVFTSTGSELNAEANLTFDGTNLGIGTTGPDSLLHMYKSSGDPQLHIQAVSGGDPTIKMTCPNNRGAYFKFGDGSTTGQFHHHQGTSSFHFRAHNQTHDDMTVSETITYIRGDTGIGTTTPSAHLDVGGATNTYSMESIILDGAGAGGLSITDNTKYLAFWAQHGGSSHNGSALGTRSNHDLAVITNDTKRMVVTAAGKVGVGTTSPQETFVVSKAGAEGIEFAPGGVEADYSLVRFYSRDASYDAVRFDADRFGFAPDGSIAVQIGAGSGNGEVGIGVTSMDAPLHVEVGAPSSADKEIAIFQSEATRQISLGWDDNISHMCIGSKTNHSFTFFTNGITNPRMTVLNNGKVGMGDTNPAHPLSVRTGNSDNSRIHLTENSTNSGTNVIFGTDQNDSAGDMFVKGYSVGFINHNGDVNYNINNARTHTWSTGYSTLTLQGTVSPYGVMKLVRDHDTAGWAFTVQNDYAGGNDTCLVEMAYSGNDLNSGIGVTMDTAVSSEYLLNLASGGSSRFRVRGDGRVGIATTSPASKLHVVGDAYAGSPWTSQIITMASANYTSRQWSLRYDDGGATGNGFSLYESSNDVRMMYWCATNGRVAINSVSPVARFHVEETTVDTNVVHFKYNADAALTSLVGMKLWNMDGTVNSKGGIHFAMSRNDGVEAMGGAIYLGRDQSWTSTASTRDNYMAFATSYNGTVQDSFKIAVDGSIQIRSAANAPNIQFNETDDTGKMLIKFALDIGEFTNIPDKPLVFKNNNTERFRIHTGGQILIGTTSAVVPGSEGIELKTSEGSFVTARVSTSTSKHWSIANGNQEVGSVQTGGYVTYFNTSSDYRLKENESPFGDALDLLGQLKPYKFNYKTEPDTEIFQGFFAHEVAEIVPQAVTGEKDAVDEDGSIKGQSIDHSHMVPLLVAAVQELTDKVETLEAKVAALEAG